MSNPCCSKCAKNFNKGELKYIVRIKVLADFDSHTGDGDTKASHDLESLIEQIERTRTEELDNDVHQEMAFLLCKDCRDVFVGNPLNLSLEQKAKKGDYSGLLH